MNRLCVPTRSNSPRSASEPTSRSPARHAVPVVCDPLFTGGPPFHLDGVRTPSVPQGTDEAEDRHSNFYDAWVNLPGRSEGVSGCVIGGSSRRWLSMIAAATSVSLRPLCCE